MEKYYQILKKCILFRNIEEKNFTHLLNCLGVQVRSFKEEEFIFFAGDEIHHVGIVLSGIVEIMKENLAGNKHIVALAEPSEMFAEGIVCTTRRISPVTVRVKEAAEILFIPYESIIKTCSSSCSYHFGLIQNMMVILGEKNVNLNKKLELLTLKGMRERLASYLIKEAMDRKSNTFQILLNRTELADYLNVSRTSMCRELARMKEDGLVDFYGHSFKILDKKGLAQCLE